MKKGGSGRNLGAACPLSCAQYRDGVAVLSGHSYLTEPEEYTAPQCRQKDSAADEALCERAGIQMRLLRELRALACRCGLHRLILFGSRARGDYWRASDIDLAAEGGNVDRFAMDADELTHTPLKYDVLNLAEVLNPRLLADVQNQGICLYEKT